MTSKLIWLARAVDAKRACLIIKERTTRPSGMHPRHPGWARDQEGLAMLLNLCEQVGAFPTSEREVLISLYRKPKGGGRRPIAGFRALYRIWGRTRKGTLQTWERQYAADGFFNTGVGRKCSDGVWRAEVRGELATGTGHRNWPQELAARTGRVAWPQELAAGTGGRNWPQELVARTGRRN